MTVGELVEALEAIPYGESLPVLIARRQDAGDTINGWLTPTEVRFDEDRVILQLGAL